MATRIHLRCTACGSLRRLDAFGIDSAGRFDETDLPLHESTLAVQEIGGRGRCSWEFRDVGLDHARALLSCLKAAATRLELEIEQAEAG